MDDRAMSTGSLTSQDLLASSTGITTAQELSSCLTAGLSTSSMKREFNEDVSMSDEKKIPLVPRKSYRAGDDGIRHLSAPPVSVSVKGPCHEQEGNDTCEIESC